MAPNFRHPIKRAPRLQPRLERPGWRKLLGIGGVLVLGEGEATSRRKRAFPSHALSSEPWVLASGSTQPLPVLWEKPVATHRHTQARRRALRRAALEPIAMATPGLLPRPTRGASLLRALQPTGLRASRERAIKPAQGLEEGVQCICSPKARFGKRGREKPENAECAEP